MLILKNTKDAIRVSICHTATVIANAYMHSGTTSDQFLRDNLEWLARATNWAKLTATASLGVIHRGHEQEALALMQSYLPKEVGPSSGYSEGGGLYALGLIHANHGANIIDYLLQQLKDAQNEVQQFNISISKRQFIILYYILFINDSFSCKLCFTDGETRWMSGLGSGCNGLP